HEQVRAENHPVLDNLGDTRDKLAPRQGLKSIHVDHDQTRLIKRTDQVLTCRVIDGGLATNTRVYLRQEGRRHLYERQTALERSSGKASHITDYPATKYNQRR